MADNQLNYTPVGAWPYLDGQNYVTLTPTYTEELAAKLANSDARVSEAVNAAQTVADYMGDTGWLAPAAMSSGFANYSSSVQLRVRAGVLYVRGTVQTTAAVTVSTATDVPLFTTPSAIRQALITMGGTTARAVIAGGVVAPAGPVGALLVDTDTVWMGYRTANPASGVYLRVHGAGLV